MNPSSPAPARPAAPRPTCPVYRCEIASRIGGIPCRIGVTHFVHQPALGRWADSDVDARGFTECEFEVLDTRGRPAPWLERKVDQRDIARITAEVADHIRNPEA